MHSQSTRQGTSLPRNGVSDTPSFFDEPEEDSALVVDDWHEVAQARFLSWSPIMQLHYCWRRDMDAALRADTETDAAFLLARATSYKHELDQLL